MNPNSYDSMMKYFDKGRGFAIPILNFIETEPITLSELYNNFDSFTVPQSYYILNNKPELLKFLLSRTKLTKN